MSKAKSGKIRVVVFKDGDMFVAQCLEHDICTQAADMKTLRHRMDALLEAERAHARASGKKPFEGIDPAPKHYVEMWETGWGAQSEGGTRQEVDLALCA